MKISWRKILGICGVCIAFYIGAGFSTMQEVMQYEVAYGSGFGLVILVAALIYIYTNLSFATNGSRMQLKRGGDIYREYCGKWIGGFFDCFSALLCYLSFIVMCGGANSTFMEQFGLPNGIGAVTLAAATVITVAFGLTGMLRALKVVGPTIITLIVFVAAWSAISPAGSFSEGMKAIDAGKYEITRVGGGNPIASGASYGGLVILWFGSFLSEIGARNRIGEVNRGMLLSSVAIFGVSTLCCIALISNIDLLWNAGVPSLVLARRILPELGILYAAIDLLGVYSSACPLLWTGLRRISGEKSRSYRILTVALGIAGCIIACTVPYRPLLNVIYGMNGYLGFVLVAFMLFHDGRVFLGKKA